MGVIYLDFSKAFDMFSHYILLCIDWGMAGWPAVLQRKTWVDHKLNMS